MWGTVLVPRQNKGTLTVPVTTHKVPTNIPNKSGNKDGESNMGEGDPNSSGHGDTSNSDFLVTSKSAVNEID